MKSAEWIEKAMAAGQFESYRQLAKTLGITDPTMSQHRSGRNRTLADEHCIMIAEICGIDPAIVIADQQAERSSPAVRKVYERLGKLALQAGAAALAIGTILPVATIDSPVISKTYAETAEQSLYYVKQAMRRILSMLRYPCCTGALVYG